jgi:hypothetical protein
MGSSLPNPDYGIDLTLNDIEVRGEHRAESGYKLDIQAKSATRAVVVGTNIQYDLDVKSYEMLRHPAPGSPRVLVVLVLPKDEARWTAQTEDELILRHCAYWMSLTGSGPTTNRRSVRLLIPRANIFSITALRAMMDRIKTGEPL